MISAPDMSSSRRTLVKGIGIAALALGGLVTGCAQQPAAGPASSPPAGTEPAPEPSTATSPTADSPSPSEDSPAPSGLQVAAASVPVGGGLILEDGDYVVTQPEAGQFKAFSKICTHQGCPVSEVAESQIICFCHGSAFSITDGSVLQGPAEEPLAETPVTASGDQLSIG